MLKWAGLARPAGAAPSAAHGAALDLLAEQNHRPQGPAWRVNGIPLKRGLPGSASPMLSTTGSVTERITTPAGQWEGGVRVKGAATLRLFADPASGWRDLPTTLGGYGPGVGLVRLEQQEPVKSACVSEGVVKMGLWSWQGR